MKVELVAKTVVLVEPHQHPESFLGSVAGICMQDSKASVGTLISCIESGHGEVLEHLKYMFYIEGFSRNGLQDLARHDVGVSMTVNGTRWNNKKDDSKILIPTVVKNDPKLRKEWEELHNKSLEVYKKTREKYGTDIARGSLVEGTHCKLYISFDLRALMHFLAQRMCYRSNFEMRELANKIYNIMKVELPIVIGEYSGPPCTTHVGCKEKNPCPLGQRKNI